MLPREQINYFQSTTVSPRQSKNTFDRIVTLAAIPFSFNQIHMRRYAFEARVTPAARYFVTLGINKVYKFALPTYAGRPLCLIIRIFQYLILEESCFFQLFPMEVSSLCLMYHAQEVITLATGALPSGLVFYVTPRNLEKLKIVP